MEMDMPSRKTLLLLSGCLLLVAAAFWYVWRLPPKHFITDGNADRILLGMTEDEAVRVLGVPAGDYITGPWAFGTPADYQIIGDVCSSYDWKVWAGDDVTVRLGFDKYGRVQLKRVVGVFLLNGERVRYEDNLLDRIRSWLKPLGLG
jgi:hypothetical protein